MLGRRRTSSGEVWNITLFTILGVVVDILFKRVGRTKFLRDVAKSVSEVTFHKVIEWDGESFQRSTTRTKQVGAGMQRFAYDLLIAIRSSLAFAGFWAVKKPDQDVKEQSPKRIKGQAEQIGQGPSQTNDVEEQAQTINAKTKPKQECQGPSEKKDCQ